MKHMLIIHDGASLSSTAKSQLVKSLPQVQHVDILYLILQNLLHYGKVDQLASPICKSEFISYVQELGVEQCKKHLEPFAKELKLLCKEHHFTIKLHVRWGNVAQSIDEVKNENDSNIVMITQNAFGIDWHSAKIMASLPASITNVLQVI